LNFQTYYQKNQFNSHVEAASSSEPGSDEEGKHVGMLEVSVGERLIPVARVPGVGVFLSDSLAKVPHTFDMYIEKTHGVPDHVVFLRVLYRHRAIIDEKKRFTIETMPNNVYLMTLNVGFAESKLPLIDIMSEALPELELNVHTVTFFLSHDVIKVITKNIFMKLVLSTYAYIKEIFPNKLAGIHLPPRSQVTLQYTWSL